MQQQYGSNPRSNNILAERLVEENKLRLEDGTYQLSDIYTTHTPFSHDTSLIQVESIPEFMPHLVTWAPVTAPRKGLLSEDAVAQMVGRYLINMTDEELLVVRAQVVRLHQRYGITGIDCYPDSFTIHTDLDQAGAQSMTVCVFNMMDSKASLHEMGERTSLN